MRHGISVSRLALADGTSVDLKQDAIVVVTGPNNAGKTTFLDELFTLFRRYGAASVKGLVVKDAEYAVHGAASEAYDFLLERHRLGNDKETVLLSNGSYKRPSIEKQWESGTLSLPIREIFVNRLDPRSRLGATNQNDEVEIAADKLFYNEEVEISISEVFRRAFGVDMILHRERKGGVFHIGDRKKLPSHKQRLTPQFKKQIEALPAVMQQGAGMRSFARIALQILTSWKTITILDEPELFLHPPQVRHLARLIASDASPETQAFIATHSESFVKGILDFDDSRVTVIRLSRKGAKSYCSVLKSDDIRVLWGDPLFRTSNVLSALFHDVAVLVEGESDVRFIQTLMGALFGAERLPDAEYFSCNGKSKIYQIAKALRSVDVPVVAMVDLDIFQNTSELLRVYEVLGGRGSDIRLDAELVKSSVESEKNYVSGRQFASELDQITSSLAPKTPVPEQTIGQVRELLKRSSPWLRIKQDGLRGLNDALATRAAKRVIEAAAAKGLLINVEGELEGFCRSVPNNNKSEWLTQVLQRDFSTDPDLDDARLFAGIVRSALEKAIS